MVRYSITEFYPIQFRDLKIKFSSDVQWMKYKYNIILYNL